MVEPQNSLILVVDRAAQEDLLLWPAVARAIARARPARLVVLHAPGETVERALEARGFEPIAGLSDAPDESLPVVRRALIEENRKVAAALTDEGVSAVPMLGASRGLLDLTEAPWFAASVRSGAVPVVLAVRGQGERFSEIDLDDASTGLARLVGPPVRIVRLAPADSPVEVRREGLSICGCVVYGLEEALRSAG